MATPIGTFVSSLNRTLLRQSAACISAQCSGRSFHQQKPCLSQDYAHTQTHVPNYRRTNAEIARALRRKQNFLHPELVEKHRNSELQSGTETVEEESQVTAPREYRHVMPEFLPRPQWEYRDTVLEKLERRDMIRRRKALEIPEFYVGSIMAVTVLDPNGPENRNRFVGLCIDRGGHGLKAYLVLRNVVEGLGVEVLYHLYSPSVVKMEVLRLEKRLDSQLYYLRDALPQYSTVDFNMEPEQLPRGAKVPVNTVKVQMRPSREWDARWERHGLEGMLPFELSKGRIERQARELYPIHPLDMMHEYRGKINEDDEKDIMGEVYKENQAIEVARRGARTSLKKKK